MKGVIAYCEVRSKEGDRSSGIKAVMKAMGATVRDNFSRDLTHIVFKDGLFSTFQKAKLLKIHLVSVLWLEAVRRHKYRVPESKYPALGVEAYDANVTAICQVRYKIIVICFCIHLTNLQALQKDYDDVVQDEYRRRSEIKHNTSVSSKNNFDTLRRKKSYAPEVSTLFILILVNCIIYLFVSHFSLKLVSSKISQMQRILQGTLALRNIVIMINIHLSHL